MVKNSNEGSAAVTTSENFYEETFTVFKGGKNQKPGHFIVTFISFPSVPLSFFTCNSSLPPVHTYSTRQYGRHNSSKCSKLGNEL